MSHFLFLAFIPIFVKGNGITTNYTYDSMGRIKTITKINYTLKKIDTEGGQDKFILVFYNKGKYDVLVDRYVDFKIYDDDYSLVHYRIFTQKKKFRLLIEELLGKSMY